MTVHTVIGKEIEDVMAHWAPRVFPQRKLGRRAQRALALAYAELRSTAVVMAAAGYHPHARRCAAATRRLIEQFHHDPLASDLFRERMVELRARGRARAGL